MGLLFWQRFVQTTTTVILAISVTKLFAKNNNGRVRADAKKFEHETADIDGISYLGCYSVWSVTRERKLVPPDDDLNAFDLPYANPSFCAEKCLTMHLDNEIALAFVRGLECKCAPGGTDDEEYYLGSKVGDENCIECSEIIFPSPPKNLHTLHPINSNMQSEFCGNNLAYSVYRVTTINIREKSVSFVNYTNSTANIRTRTDENSVSPKLIIRCAQCQLNDVPCKVIDDFSPSFDYFPYNTAKDCVEFCGSNIDYYDWNENTCKKRDATPEAIMVLWRPNTVPLTMCFCGSHDPNSFPTYDGPCVPCPAKDDEYDYCGGLGWPRDGGGWTHEVFASVYFIENDPPTTSSTEETSTPPSSSTELTTTMTSATTKQSTESTPTEFVSTISMPTETSSTTSSSTRSISTTFATTTATPKASTVKPCNDTCNKTDRHGHNWTVACNQVKYENCSRLVRGSSGYASWKCEYNGKFATKNPNVFQCQSAWVDKMQKKIQNMTSIDRAKELTGEILDGCSRSQQNSSFKYFGHEIADLSALLNQILDNANSFTSIQEEFEYLVNESVKLDACLINTHEPWDDLPLENKTFLSSQLMNATEDALFHLTYFVTQKDYSRMFTPMEQFMAVAETFYKNSVQLDEPYLLPPKTDPSRDTCIKLPEKWTTQVNETKIEIALLSLAPECLAKIMTGTGVYEVNGETGKMINGRMISLSVTSSSPETRIKGLRIKPAGIRSKSLKFWGKGVEIGFHHVVDAWGDQPYDVHRDLHPGEMPKVAQGGAKCVFWDMENHLWSTEGCKLLKISRTQTVCECSHLTSFAVLMDVHRYVGKQLGLEILTLILCPLSELSLFITILILSVVRNGVHKMRTTISKHLSCCLFLGNGMILIFLDRHYFHLSDGLCMGAAMVAHYMFLCAFMWMLLGGVQLYRMVVNVFDSGKSYMKHFGVVAYGSPVIIVGITAAIGHANSDKPYGGDAYCWLVGNYIWAFMVPVAVVITTNLVILFIALKTSYQLQHQGQRDKKLSLEYVIEKLCSYRVYFKGCFSLTVVLGITWVAGFFVLLEGPPKVVAAYLFTILNASQGFFIFLFTCRAYVGNLGVFTRRKLSSYFPSLLISNSNSSSMTFKKPHVISQDKMDFGRRES